MSFGQKDIIVKYFSFGADKPRGRENDKYLELLANFILLTHGSTPYKHQKEKMFK